MPLYASVISGIIMLTNEVYLDLSVGMCDQFIVTFYFICSHIGIILCIFVFCVVQISSTQNRVSM